MERTFRKPMEDVRKLTTNNTNAVTENANKLAAIERKIESKPVTRPDCNIQSIERLILSSLERINKTIDEKPVPVKRESCILLFPDIMHRNTTTLCLQDCLLSGTAC